MQIVTLGKEHLEAARELLSCALQHDRVSLVADEKLFASGSAFGAFEGSELVGVAAFERRWVKLLAVDERHRRRGIGSALLSQLREKRRRVMDCPGNYLSPGLDVRYGEARAWLERRGFRAVGEVENLRATAFERTLDVPEYEIRRADEPALLEWISRTFAPVWALEVSRAMRGPRRAVHVAMQQKSYAAFAAADGNNQGLGWFGPAGTDESHRGKRLGEALLLRCLQDVRGLPEAGVIAWIGPKEFYRKTVGAVEDRRFVQMEEA